MGSYIVKGSLLPCLEVTSAGQQYCYSHVWQGIAGVFWLFE